MDTGDLSKLALFLVCLGLSGFFSASETAFIALPRARLLHLISIGRPGAGRVEKLLEKPEKFLATRCKFGRFGFGRFGFGWFGSGRSDRSGQSGRSGRSGRSARTI